jgi:hypothetical protein
VRRKMISNSAYPRGSALEESNREPQDSAESVEVDESEHDEDYTIEEIKKEGEKGYRLEETPRKTPKPTEKQFSYPGEKEYGPGKIL